ncbi:hypothetical protein [Nocardioides convexus]|uniref:hypothetical protein n=1 Tax=Nocardioides convexus TaxID=2712224 RepID=UPI0024189BD3|nr:hypothetical protein [Nocardioides convexus]
MAADQARIDGKARRQVRRRQGRRASYEPGDGRGPRRVLAAPEPLPARHRPRRRDHRPRAGRARLVVGVCSCPSAWSRCCRSWSGWSTCSSCTGSRAASVR